MSKVKKLPQDGGSHSGNVEQCACYDLGGAVSVGARACGEARADVARARDEQGEEVAARDPGRTDAEAPGAPCPPAHGAGTGASEAGPVVWQCFAEGEGHLEQHDG